MIYQLRNLQTDHPYLVPPGTAMAGRNDDVQILIDHDSVSRRHARLENSGGSLWIEDLQSTNGTIVRGNVIDEKVRIEPGEAFQIGLVDFKVDEQVYEEGNAPEPADTPKIEWERFMRKTNRVPRFEKGVLENAPPRKTQKVPTPPSSGAAVVTLPPTAAPTHVPAATHVMTNGAHESAVVANAGVPWKVVLAMTFGAGSFIGMLLGMIVAKLLGR